MGVAHAHAPTIGHIALYTAYLRPVCLFMSWIISATFECFHKTENILAFTDILGFFHSAWGQAGILKTRGLKGEHYGG